MPAYGTKQAEKFGAAVQSIYFQRSVAEVITNQDYEGEIKDQASILNIPFLAATEWTNYTGADATPQDLEESSGQLVTNQKKKYYVRIYNIKKFESYIKKPEGTVIDTAAKGLKKLVDQFVLGFYGDAAAGNRVGTDYTTGTVTVDVTTGAVTGSGTTFTAAMVGRGFKATGHTKWYRVKSYASGTSIVIEDDLDDVTSAYTGGAIAGGATYIIEAATAVQVTKDTVYAQINSLAVKLDDLEIPDEDRWLVVPSAVASLIRQSSAYTPAIESAWREVVRRGLVGELAGFTIYKSSRCTGDAVNGWHLLAGHKSAITYANGLVDSHVEPWLPGNSGIAYFGLSVYGAKVTDERRKALAEFFCKL